MLWKGRKALEEEEGPWKEMGFLGRKGALGRNGSWEGEALGAACSVCTDLCSSRREVRRVLGALSSSGESLCVVHVSWELVGGCVATDVL